MDCQKLVLIVEWSYFEVVLVAEFYCIQQYSPQPFYNTFVGVHSINRVS